MKKSMCLRMCLYEKIIHDAKPNMNSKYKTTCCVPTKNSSGLTYTTSKFNIRNPKLIFTNLPQTFQSSVQNQQFNFFIKSSQRQSSQFTYFHYFFELTEVGSKFGVDGFTSRRIFNRTFSQSSFTNRNLTEDNNIHVQIVNIRPQQ